MLNNNALPTAPAAPAPDAPAARRQPANLQSIGIILLSVAFGAVGQLVFKAAMNSLTEGGPLELTLDRLVRMATNRVLIVGVGIFGISTLLWLVALSRADLSFAYPFLSLTYFVVLLGGALLFNEAITPARVLGFVVVIAGLLIVARSGKAD